MMVRYMKTKKSEDYGDMTACDEELVRGRQAGRLVNAATRALLVSVRGWIPQLAARSHPLFSHSNKRAF